MINEKIFNKITNTFKTTDPIYIPTIEEYEKYKNNIPRVHTHWWLRSQGVDQRFSAVVFDDAVAYRLGYHVNSIIGVRPFIEIEDGIIGSRIIKYNFPFIVIDNNIAIAEVPIAYRMYDLQYNNYYNSEIRKFLLQWINR